MDNSGSNSDAESGSEDLCNKMKELRITYNDLPEPIFKRQSYRCQATLRNGDKCESRIRPSNVPKYGKIYCGDHQSFYEYACDDKLKLKKCSRATCNNRIPINNKYKKCESCKEMVRKHDEKRKDDSDRIKYISEYNKSDKAKEAQEKYNNANLEKRREQKRLCAQKRRAKEREARLNE
jgi:hypothetical protein